MKSANWRSPMNNGVDERGVLNRHADTKLQTRLTSKGLQKRLLDMYLDARTLEEEQGVNILVPGAGHLEMARSIECQRTCAMRR